MTQDQIEQAPPSPSFSEAFFYWLKLGFISFGGPAGQISMMHQELVEKRRWISERRFMHALNYCMVLPGPEAQQLATYIGWLLHGTWGGIISGGLFVLPSLFILIFLSWIYMAFGAVPAVAGVLYGIKPAVTAIVVFAAYRIGSRALANGALWAISATAFIAISAFNVPFPYIVLGAGLIGYIGGKFSPARFNLGGSHASAKKSFGPAVIDDHSPKPEHSHFQWKRLAIFTCSGLGLWIAVLGLIAHQYGWRGDFTQIGWFFTKAALMTFGGAYAVLPYVYQGAVEQYHWLTATQMIDGLALGETTPGPLIMVVAFVGFVGAWAKGLLGPEVLFTAGAIGALIATFFTFLPSFLFILIGGPLVESTHGDLKFTSPLTGITAAVVGVILNLAVFFAYHVLWPQGWNSHFEWFSCLITLSAGTALIRFKTNIIPVIGISGLAGLLYLAAR
jgi:chromate transporter